MPTGEIESYYVDIAGKTAGPFSIRDLARMYRGGGINANNIYARPDSQDWLPISTLVPIFNELSVEKPPIQLPQRSASSVPMCGACGYTGKMQVLTRGSFAIEILLYLFFCLPGVIYTVWRLTSGKEARCPKCGSLQ